MFLKAQVSLFSGSPVAWTADTAGCSHLDPGAVITPPLIVRFVEPIDRSSYLQQGSSRADVMDPEAVSHSGVCSSQTAQASAEGTRLSFAEVMQLVQEGKEVPGVRELDVKPTNQSPTPSQMERMRKPWEISSASE